MRNGTEGGSGLDGARLAIMYNRFEDIATKMGAALLRAGRSGVINRGKDFSCCVVSANCELLVAAESLPAHVLGAELIARSMHESHPELKPGDAFLHNSPYHGNGHAADHTILAPVMDDEGRHRFTVLAKAHLADIGNSIPTTYHATAKDVYEEGALIFPAVQIQRDYNDIQDIVRMCEMRIRVPEQWRGDYLAMVGAARTGEQEITTLASEVGWDLLEEFVSAWLTYSETRMRAAIRAMPKGRATTETVHDEFPGTMEGGIPIRSSVTIDPDEELITIDLRDNPDNIECGLNLSEATSITSALIGVFNSIDHGVPKNSGSCSRVKVLLREGCIAGIPKHPTSCSVATSNIADRVTSATQMSIAKIAYGYGMAEAGAILPPALGVVSGKDPRNGKAYVNQVILGMTGGAGNPHNDGWLTLGCNANAGMSYHDSIELDELYHPFRVYERRLLPDSEGAGERRGAPSCKVEFGPIASVMEIGYASDGADHPAQGVLKGGAGRGASQQIRNTDGTVEELPNVYQVRLQPGEAAISVCCGGGGYGDPKVRDPELVARDVSDGLVSPERAKEIYGVIIDRDGRVDPEATLAARQN